MTSSPSPRVLVLAVGMGTGGAEALIRDSLPLLRAEGFDLSLWVLKEGGAQLGAIRQSGQCVRALSGSRAAGASLKSWLPVLTESIARRSSPG